MSWVDLAVVGIGCDIAGAVVLAWSFSTKKPHQIRPEVPRAVTVVNTPGSVSAAFPQGLARSLARQRAEARLGLAFLFVGFAMQAASYFFPHPAARLQTWPERVVAIGFVLLSWIAAFVDMKTYLPWDEAQTWNQIESGEIRVSTLASRLVRDRMRRSEGGQA